MINTLFNYQPKGLTKEEVIAEFNNLMPWEQQEVLEEINQRTSLSFYTTQELKDELSWRK